MQVVIYARYSSHSQSEQSIEGQIDACRAYASACGYVVIGEYIDMAQSGKQAEGRTEFQRMVRDSKAKLFQGVLVYQFDRFARSRHDSAVYKARLAKNGVKVISAREHISDDASGMLIEGVLDVFSEYSSHDLAQKIRRGMGQNAQKFLSNGSNPGLGYLVDKDKRFQVNPDTAPTVRRIFEMYAEGQTVTAIIAHLNTLNVKTSLGRPFTKNSLNKLLRNKRYVGYYVYNGEAVLGGMPRLIDDALFDTVQAILARNKKAPARARAREAYLLTTKLVCGQCQALMTGYSGTSRSGKRHNYYICNNTKRKCCDKNTVRKDYIENFVVEQCRALLTDDNIERIAKEVVAACRADSDRSIQKRLKFQLKELDGAIENLLRALEKGQSIEPITARLDQRMAEKKDILRQLVEAERVSLKVTIPEVRFFLQSLQKGAVDDPKYREHLVTAFVSTIYLHDDRVSLVFKSGDQPVEVSVALIDSMAAQSDSERCSSNNASAPPKE